MKEIQRYCRIIATSKRLEWLRFVIVGVPSVFLQSLTLYVTKEFLGFPMIIASFLGGAVNFAISFYFQRAWTFKNNDKESQRQHGVWYFLVRLGMLVGNALVLHFFNEQFERKHHYWYIGMQVFLIAFFSVISFVVSKWIFARKTQ